MLSGGSPLVQLSHWGSQDLFLCRRSNFFRVDVVGIANVFAASRYDLPSFNQAPSPWGEGRGLRGKAALVCGIEGPGQLDSPPGAHRSAGKNIGLEGCF